MTEQELERMTKNKQEFESSCFELISLMYEGSLKNPEILNPGEFAYSEKHGERVIFFHDIRNYKLKTNYLTEKIIDLNDFEKNTSLEYLTKKINRFLIDCFFIEKEERHVYINNFYDKIIKELNECKREYIVPLLIENLSFDSEMTIGNVEFIQYTIENCKKIIKADPLKTHIPEIYLPNPENAEKVSERVKQVKSIGIVKVISTDTKKAIEKAYEEVEQALNIIRLFNVNSYFGIFGDYNKPTFYQVVAIDSNTGSISSMRGWDGDMLECKFSINELPENGKKVFENIRTILKKEKKEDMENKLLVAINIFGDIQKNREKQHNISKIFTALETLLVFERFENKGESIAERTVFINQVNKEDRIQKYGQLIKMYKCRNDLVHYGKTAFKRSEYNTLLAQLVLCILNVAKHIDKYPKQENWVKIIKEAKETMFNTKLIFQ